MSGHHGGKGDNRLMVLVFTGILAGFFLASYMRFESGASGSLVVGMFGKAICTYGINQDAYTNCFGRMLLAEAIVVGCAVAELIFAHEKHRHLLFDLIIFLICAIGSFAVVSVFM